MGLYAIQNRKGDLRDADGDTLEESTQFCVWVERTDAERERKDYYPGGHVVELVQVLKEQVTSEEAEMLEEARTSQHPAFYIGLNGSDKDHERLMRAYVNGYEIFKPERYYVVPVDGTQDVDGNYRYAYKEGDGSWAVSDYRLANMSFPADKWQVTESDLDNAPAWVKTLNAEEVQK